METIKPSVVELFKDLKSIVDAIPVDFGGGCPLSKSFLMAYIALKYDLKNYVEIGVYMGRSFLPMAHTIKLIGGKAYGIDPYDSDTAKEFDLAEDKRRKVNEFLDTLDFPKMYQNVFDLCLKLNLDDCSEIIREKSSRAARHFQRDSIDMLHIDGNHDTKYVMEDVDLYFPLVRDGGFIVVDDIDWDSVKPAYRKLQELCDIVFDKGSYAILRKGIRQKNMSLLEKRKLNIIHGMVENIEKSGKTLVNQFPKVSVIVISHNQEEYIAECLEGILAQKGEFKLELVIGDDGSSDTTLEVIKSYAENLRSDKIDVKILTADSPMGVTKNFQRCLDSCTGEYIVVCEVNDYWIDVNRIQKQKYYDELIYRKTRIVSEKDKWDIAIIDDGFPNPVSAFRRQEFDSYLEEFENIKIYTTPNSVRGKSKDELIANFRKKSAQHSHQIEIFKPDIIIDVKLVYMIFLGNAYAHIDYLERIQTPFVFTLYPGGKFGLNNAESDRMLKRVTSSPCFRKVIVTQEVTYNYLIENKYCTPDQIKYIYGVVVPIQQINAEYSDKERFGFDKDSLDICFVAAKYTEKGVDKGYDVFIDVAKKLCEKYDNIYFHVVGGFSEQDIEIATIKDRITFYGYKLTEWFDAFYRDKDIILLPNAPFTIHEGQFDGFPTGTCVDAGLRKTAVFCTDELHMNKHFIKDQEIVIIPHDALQIVDIIESYYYNPETLKMIAENGYHKMKSIYSYEAQILPRINILKKEIEIAEGNTERVQAVQLLVAQKAEHQQSVQASIAQKIAYQQSMQVLTTELTEREKELREIKSSKAWKTALILRRIRVVLAPPNGLVVRMLRRLMDFARGQKIKEDSALLRSSGLFDEVWYLEKNPDIARAKIDPALHYLRYGGFEGRNPGPEFDGNWYLDTYEDVRKAGVNPLVHYLKYGRVEGRLTQPLNSKQGVLTE